MAYQRVGDFLDHVRALHRAFQRHYAQSAYWQKDDRLRLLLQRMATEEKELAAALATWGDEAQQTVRDTWLQYVPLEKVYRVLEDIAVDPNADIEQVVAQATALDTALMEAYQVLASSLLPPRVRSVFRSLARMEDNKGKQRSLGAAELFDSARPSEPSRPDQPGPRPSGPPPR